VQFRKRVTKAIECGVDRIATGVEAEIVAGDLPARAELVEHTVGPEAAPDQLAQRLLDRILLRLEAREPLRL
jgi:hypothetical protein